MTTIRDYLTSIRMSLNRTERELDAKNEADKEPSADIAMMLARMDWEAERVANMAKSQVVKEEVSQ